MPPRAFLGLTRAASRVSQLVECHLAENRLSETWPMLDKLQKASQTTPMYSTNPPASFRVNQLSGEIFEIQGRYQDASAENRKAIQKNPAALNLPFRLGRALLRESHDAANLPEARKQFEAELPLNPADAVAEYQVGQILVAEQDGAGAAARFQKAVNLNPDFAEARFP